MTKLKVKLTRSPIGTTQRQYATIVGLGLRKLNGERILENTPAVRGMVRQVLHMVDVTEVDE